MKHVFLQSNRRLWLRVFLWCGVISIFSSIPNYRGKEISFETLLDILEFVAVKCAHLFEYAVLMFFFFRAFEKSWEKLSNWRLLLSFLFIILFSVSDEWHQTFVYGRTGSPMDVFIDAVGSLLGYFYAQRLSLST